MPEISQPETIDQVVTSLNEALLNGSLPSSLPPELAQYPSLVDLMNNLVQINQMSLSLANGKLDGDIHMRGRIAGALKSLQANLRHLTWQTQAIASGDLTQRVAFMGEFASAFNTMVEQIAQSRSALEQHALELSEQRQNALNLANEASLARHETEQANIQLQEQLVQIQELHAQLREQAIRDPLTGCFNRRYFKETIDREFSRALRENYPVSFIMIDIDRFKLVNDTYGHPAGDEVLKMLGLYLLELTRVSDMVTRYGGEEFLIMLPNMTKTAATARAEQIREVFSTAQIEIGPARIACTLSAGVTCFPQDGETEVEIVEKADNCLYRAKQAGRNRVVVY